MKSPQVLATEAGEFTLDAAILVYRNSRQASGYISTHTIERGDDGRAQLGTGKPACRRDIANLLDFAGADLGIRGWMGENVLYTARDVMVWWRPASPATMFFTSPKAQGQAAQPALVFAVAGNAWYVWALERNERPTPSTMLQNAPYFNVWKDGQICTGDVKLPAEIAPDTTADIEATFFNSRFTHPNHDAICTRIIKPADLWKTLMSESGKPFPAQLLVPYEHTLGQVVESLRRKS
jgi:PRTRC genetic system protein B